MTGIQALTEKEKETLRLLVDGHDAKSMARHLGLSVHTINERLRDARGKMAVSSSREAARQLREIERPDPEIHGPKALGGAPEAAATEDRSVPAEAPRMVRPLGRSEEHTSELQSLMRSSYAVFCLQKKQN